MPDAPATLGPYRLLRLLGEGGMARVYEGEHVETGARHAIKELLFKTGDLDALQRFQREAELAVALNHPHIARTHTADLSPPHPYLALELLGESLEERLAAGPLSSEEARAVLDQIAAGVAHAHAQGVIHRDLKPGNVLFSATGVAKVTDFGIAVGARVDRLTLTGELLGTPDYMAPEQIDDPHSVDARADVYALGAILYRVLSGQAPFSGHSNLMSTLLAVRDEAPPPLPAGVDPALAAACRTALAKDPTERFKGAEAFRAALFAPAQRRGWIVGLGGALALVLVGAVVANRIGGSQVAPKDALPAQPEERSPPLAPVPTRSPSALPRGFAQVGGDEAQGKNTEVLVSYLPDGALARYDTGRLIVGGKVTPIPWDEALRKPEARFPSFMLPLGEGRMILGHPGRSLLWTARPRFNSHMGATVALHTRGLVIIGSDRRHPDGHRAFLRVMDAADGSHRSKIQVGKLPVRALASGPRGTVLVGLGTLVAMGEGTLQVWRLDAAGGLTLKVARKVFYTPECIAVCPDGERILVGASQGGLWLERVADLSPAGRFVANDENLKIAQLAHLDSVILARFLSAKRLITVGRAGPQEDQHGHLSVWDVPTTTELLSTKLGLRPRHASIRIHPDGSASIAVGGLNRYEVWTYRD